ncbi:hypothetical protein [Tenacibaculum jejuense]|uniref:Uncharacterized protein n=1 Tax=Tenacibaculum jejuense TaxID=584609 RepID=A0A238U8A3_9FLAO|nr:hypothetical protein [Tenacibaculum jejuense]SNR15423.1 protein of unknown function [Tenacibaculum jejuense]
MKYSRHLLIAFLIGSFSLAHSQRVKKREVKKTKTNKVTMVASKDKDQKKINANRNKSTLSKTLKVEKPKAVRQKKTDDTPILKRKKN